MKGGVGLNLERMMEWAAGGNQPERVESVPYLSPYIHCKFTGTSKRRPLIAMF